MPGIAENPASALLEVMREAVRGDGAPAWDWGIVVSASPLSVQFRGVTLRQDQIADGGLWARQLVAGTRVAVLPNHDGTLFAILRPYAAV